MGNRPEGLIRKVEEEEEESKKTLSPFTIHTSLSH
jgi:hypothetical protein